MLEFDPFFWISFRKTEVNDLICTSRKEVWRRMPCESSRDTGVGECVWYLSKNHKCFRLLFVGKEKKIRVLANTYANCHLFFKTIRNANVYGFWMLPSRIYLLCCFLMNPTLEKTEDKASVSYQMFLLKFEKRSEDLIREVHFKFR